MEFWLAVTALVLACTSATLAIGAARIQAAMPPRPHAVHDDEVVSRVATTLDGRNSWVPPTPDAFVIFTLSGCSHCERLLGQLVASGVPRPYLVIEQGTEADLRARAERLGLTPAHLVADPEGTLLDAYGVERVPHAIRLDAGRVTRVLPVDELVNFSPDLLR